MSVLQINLIIFKFFVRVSELLILREGKKFMFLQTVGKKNLVVWGFWGNHRGRIFKFGLLGGR